MQVIATQLLPNHTLESCLIVYNHKEDEIDVLSIISTPIKCLFQYRFISNEQLQLKHRFDIDTNLGFFLGIQKLIQRAEKMVIFSCIYERLYMKRVFLNKVSIFWTLSNKR